MVVVDEDYTGFGLSGEIAALCLEANLKFKYRRVATDSTIPYDRIREDEVLPGRDKIVSAVTEIRKAGKH